MIADGTKAANEAAVLSRVAGAERFFLTARMIERQAGWHPEITTADGDRFKVDRVGLLIPGRQWPVERRPAPQQIAAARAWLDRLEAVQTPTINSYLAKHWAERWAESYIANGALLAAASRLGIPMIPADRSIGPPVNCRLALARRPLRSLPEVRQGELR